MNPITGYATVPGTLVSEPIANPAATIVTKTIVHTVTMNAATSTIATSGNTLSSSHAFTPPVHLYNTVTDLYKQTKYKSLNVQVGSMAPALKYILAAAVTGGLAALYVHWKSPPPAPPGEVQRTWKQKIRFAYSFLKGAASENEQLRRDIAQAHEDLARTRLENEPLEANGEMEVDSEDDEDDDDDDEELVKTEANNKLMHRQMNVYAAETMAWRARVDALELQNAEHPQVLQNLESQLEDSKVDKLQLQRELKAAEQAPDELRQQLEEVEKQTKTLIREHSSALKDSEKLREQLEQLEKEKGTLETRLSSATENTAALQQQFIKLKADKNTLTEGLQTAQQKPDQLHEQTMQLQAENNKLPEDLEQTSAAQSSQQEELGSVQKQRDDLQSLVKTLQKNEEILSQRLQKAEHEAQENMDLYAKSLEEEIEAREYGDERNQLLEQMELEVEQLKADNKVLSEKVTGSKEVERLYEIKAHESNKDHEDEINEEKEKRKALEEEIEHLKAHQSHTSFHTLHPRALLGHRPAFELSIHASPPPISSSVAIATVKTERDTTQNHEKMSLSQHSSSKNLPIPENPITQITLSSLASSPPASSAPASNTPSKKRRRDLEQPDEGEEFDGSTPRFKRRANPPQKTFQPQSTQEDTTQLEDPTPVLDMANKPTFARPDGTPSLTGAQASRIPTTASVRKSTRNTTKPQSYNIGMLGRAVSPEKDATIVKCQARSVSPAKKTDEVPGTAKKLAGGASPSKIGARKGSPTKKT